MRALRQSAGAARDWDVFYTMVQAAPALNTDRAHPARDLLLGAAVARRMAAQDLLVEVAEREGREFHKETRNLIQGSFEWQRESQATLGDLARHTVAALMREIDEMMSPPPSKYVDLHQLRIRGKRLRYSMELFATCFAPPFREQLYPAVVEMQETLGLITDAHVAGERIGEIRDHLKSFHAADWPRYRQPIQQLIETQRRVMPRERKRFLTWLPNWRKLTAEIEPAVLLLEK